MLSQCIADSVVYIDERPLYDKNGGRMNDKEIIELYWKRSENAIIETDKKYRRYCHTIAYNILHNDEDAEECVNDTYWGAWKSIPPQTPNCLSAFLGKITRNLSLNRYKLYTTKKRGMGQTALALSELEDCIPAENDVEQISDEKFLIESIEKFLYAQPKFKRDIFVRRYWYMSAIKEIADENQMSESKIVSMLLRMRNQLKLHLEKEGIVL